MSGPLPPLVAYTIDHPAAFQTGLFVFTIVGCWLLESLLLHGGFRRKRRRASVNGMLAACALPVQLVMALGCVALAQLAASRGWGVFRQFSWDHLALLEYAVMFVVLDLLDWVYHVAMHKVPVFWRYHLVHHTDQAIDVSTTVREHPGETVVRNGFLMTWIVLCGVPLEMLVLRQTVETVANILAHTSFRLRGRAERVLGWVLITPNLHHVHHHAHLPYTDRNYGDVFSVWDRLFGTFATLVATETKAGLDSHAAFPDDHGFASILAMPFTSHQDATGQHAGSAGA